VSRLSECEPIEGEWGCVGWILFEQNEVGQDFTETSAVSLFGGNCLLKLKQGFIANE
jgi:hypothetical protein